VFRSVGFTGVFFNHMLVVQQMKPSNNCSVDSICLKQLEESWLSYSWPTIDNIFAFSIKLQGKFHLSSSNLFRDFTLWNLFISSFLISPCFLEYSWGHIKTSKIHKMGNLGDLYYN